MEALAIYLLKSASWLTGFALIYFLFLQNERFFKLKRIYLISGIPISFIFPLISFHYQVEVPSPDLLASDFIQEGGASILVNPPVSPDKAFDFRIILLLLYVAGVIFLAFRMALNIRSIFKTINRAKINNQGPVRLIRAAEFPSSFSFFNYVFINPSVNETETEEIMNHELVHVRQKHWFDLLLVEIIRLVQWVNPFAWIYTGFIRLNHEYLADEAALQRTSNPAIYRAALVNQLLCAPVISLANSFNYSLNKKRFEMMKKIITSPYRKMKVLFVLPVFAILFYAFATPEYHYAVPSNDSMTIIEAPVIIVKDLKGVVLKEDGTPFTGVPILVTGTNIRTKTDASGNFALSDVPENAFIVFSYRGYITQVLKADFKSAMSVKLMKDPDYKEVRVVSFRDGTDGPELIRNGNITEDPALKPLIVIDGEISEKGVNETDPDMISTISVLKDKSATAVFGDKGKNGVIIITTKNPIPAIGQKEVKGVVQNEAGKPLLKACIMSTGTPGKSFIAFSDADGRFSIKVNDDASLVVTCTGYNGTILKPPFSSDVFVKLAPASENNEVIAVGKPVVVQTSPSQRVEPLIVIDDIISTKPRSEVLKEIGDQIASMKSLSAKDATEKYGEKGKNGAMEIMTLARAKELGIKVPFRRRNPEDYPTFRGEIRGAFISWVVSQVKYPADAATRAIQGIVRVRYTVETDGTVSNVKYDGTPNPILGDAVLRVVQSSPKWEPAKNPEANEPYNSTVAVKFELPDKVGINVEPFVVVEEMPMYPGGDAELLKFIANNTQYPDSAKAKNIQGRVIVRFVVTTEGNTDEISVLKGVDPLLDDEAVRVIDMIKGFKPGYQGGRPVPVWYMVPVTFTLK